MARGPFAARRTIVCGPCLASPPEAPTHPLLSRVKKSLPLLACSLQDSASCTLHPELQPASLSAAWQAAVLDGGCKRRCFGGQAASEACCWPYSPSARATAAQCLRAELTPVPSSKSASKPPTAAAATSSREAALWLSFSLGTPNTSPASGRLSTQRCFLLLLFVLLQPFRLWRLPGLALQSLLLCCGGGSGCC